MVENAQNLHQGIYSVTPQNYISIAPPQRSHPIPCKRTPRRLPSVCQACGTWCGDLLQADAICKITGKPGCLLRYDRRFKEVLG